MSSFLILFILITYNLKIENKGSTPTFVNAIRKEIIDLTPRPHFMTTKITNHAIQEAFEKKSMETSISKCALVETPSKQYEERSHEQMLKGKKLIRKSNVI